MNILSGLIFAIMNQYVVLTDNMKIAIYDHYDSVLDSR